MEGCIVENWCCRHSQFCQVCGLQTGLLQHDRCQVCDDGGDGDIDDDVDD